MDHHGLKPSKSWIHDKLVDSTKIELFLILVLSRLPLLLCMIIADWFVEDYDTSTSLLFPSSAVDYESLPSVSPTSSIKDQNSPYPLLSNEYACQALTSVFRCTRHWDVIHFTHIAIHGYTHEHLHAFYPAIPMTIRAVRKASRFAVNTIFGENIEDIDISHNGASSAGFGWMSCFTGIISAIIPIRCSADQWCELLESFVLLLIGISGYAFTGVALRELTLLVYNNGSNKCISIKGQRDTSSSSLCDRLDTQRKIARPSALYVVFHTSSDSNISAVVCATMVSYILTSAGVFTVIPYTETIFSSFAFLGMIMFEKSKRVSSEVGEHIVDIGKKPIDTTRTSWSRKTYLIMTVILFMIAATARSNGILLSVYFAHEGLLRCISRIQQWWACIPSSEKGNGNSNQDNISSRNTADLCSLIIDILQVVVKSVCCTVVVLIPYMAVSAYGYNNFCTVARDSDTDVPGQSCPSLWISFYSYLQTKYWNVYPFSAYTLKNSPNFLIPAPLVAFVVITLIKYWKPPATRDEEKDKHNHKKGSVTNHYHHRFTDRFLLLTLDSHMMSFLLMLVFGVILIHIQVLVRFLFVCPALYWLFGALLLKSGSSGRATHADGDITCHRVDGVQEDVDEGGGISLRTVFLAWCSLWITAGCMSFSNHLPWT
eukprot:Tbor_TRINITY_DN4629_c0_g1::TRINITY_DN4629_c0_g1_i1::g.14990::m.14990/K07542/PIGV; phosphatidylinositol glycan, class V